MTKHRIVSVLMILAMVASLCAVMVAPASALAVTATAVAPSYGGATAGYTVTFTAGAALPTAGTDWVQVLFPLGTTVPASVAKNTVRINGVVPTVDPFIVTNTGASAATHPKGISVVVPVAVPAAAGQIIQFSSAAGIVNPTVPGVAYTTQIVTSQEAEVAGIAYAITTDVAISPGTGPAGTAITMIGGGFAKNSSIDVYADNGAGVGVANDQIRNGSEPIVASSTVSATGTISVTVTASTTASARLCAVDGAGTNAATSPNFAILASAAATPSSGLVTSKLTVTGSNYPGAAVIAAVNFSGAAMAAVATENALVANSYWVSNQPNAAPVGTLIIKLIPPATATAGPKTIAITEGAITGTATFDVTGAAITVTPSSGPAGASAILAGTGFAASQTAGGGVVFTDAAATATTVVATITTGADGSVSATFQIPGNAAPGVGTVVATDNAGRTAVARFTVSPASITLSSNVGPAGSSVTLTGAGFPAYSGLVLTIGAANVSPSPTVLTDASGNLTATFIVPALGTGPQIVTATAGGAAPTSIYTITAPSVAVVSGFSTIVGKYTKIWAFDGGTQEWMLYDTAAGTTSTLSTLVRGQGYWVEVTENTVLVYSGNSYTLTAGWNLIGWLG